jgi:hypothetical protein
MEVNIFQEIKGLKIVKFLISDTNMQIKIIENKF